MRSRKTATFPRWAPDSIVTLCESASAALASTREHRADADTMTALEVEAHVCERLARDLAMQPVWEALHGRPRWQQGPKGDDRKLVQEIVSETLQVRPWRTLGERKRALTAMAERADELRELLLSLATELPTWVRPDEENFADELDRLSTEATARAGQPVRHIKRTPNAPALYLALRLNHFFLSVLGKPLHEHVASIANTVYDSDLTVDDVKAAVRHAKLKARRAAESGRGGKKLR
jgi:hypothetical protein